MRGSNEQFLRFAVNTHAIGNFIVGPIGFNCKEKYSKAKIHSCRNWNLFYRPDLFLESLKTCENTDWRRWFEENMDKLYYSYFYETLVHNDENVDLERSKIICLGEENGWINRIKKINDLIEARGKEMIADLREVMEGQICLN